MLLCRRSTVLLVVLSLMESCCSLRLVGVRVPKYIIKGSTAHLECIYDLDGDTLYSVKWYKDGNEFYRFVPKDMPPAQTFSMSGVNVDLYNSSNAAVALRDVNFQTAGRFRCEVSGEAPAFQTVTENADMVVVYLPDQATPQIIGTRSRYTLGDTVRANCTAGRSKPATQLSWYINGEPADPIFIQKFNNILSGRETLETSILGIKFRADQRLFKNGEMKLKCVASLSNFYWRSNEECIEGDRPQNAPVLESRKTVYATNSRIHDSGEDVSLRETFATKILSFFVQPNAASCSSRIAKQENVVLLIVLVVFTLRNSFKSYYKENVMEKSKENANKKEQQENKENINKEIQENEANKCHDNIIVESNAIVECAAVAPLNQQFLVERKTFKEYAKNYILSLPILLEIILLSSANKTRTAATLMASSENFKIPSIFCCKSGN